MARRLEAGMRNVRDLLIEWPLANGHLLTHRLLATISPSVLRIKESKRRKKVFSSSQLMFQFVVKLRRKREKNSGQKNTPPIDVFS